MNEFGSNDFDPSEYIGSYVHPGTHFITSELIQAYGTVNVNVTTSGNISWSLNYLYSETAYVGDDFFIGYVEGPFLLNPAGPLVVPVRVFVSQTDS